MPNKILSHISTMHGRKLECKEDEEGRAMLLKRADRRRTTMDKKGSIGLEPLQEMIMVLGDIDGKPSWKHKKEEGEDGHMA